jgi:hypothetical protein
MPKAKPRHMTATQYTAALAMLKLTQAGAAVFLGIGLRTSNGYANERTRIPRATQLLLELMIARNIKPEDLT